MNYLTHAAADTFYSLTMRSYDLHLISRWELERNLACLCAMIDLSEPFYNRLRRSLTESTLEIEGDSDEGPNCDDAVVGFGDDEGETPTRDYRSIAPPVLSLIVNGVTGMKKWVFHEFDEDPYPSVPHGHEHGHKHPKLDPYTGMVFDSHRKEITQERLKKKARITLWNNQDFREFALKAIIWYQEAHPLYRFRVTHPRRLPRFR